MRNPGNSVLRPAFQPRLISYPISPQLRIKTARVPDTVSGNGHRGRCLAFAGPAAGCGYGTRVAQSAVDPDVAWAMLAAMAANTLQRNRRERASGKLTRKPPDRPRARVAHCPKADIVCPIE